jgi:hypothetical protein
VWIQRGRVNMEERNSCELRLGWIDWGEKERGWGREGVVEPAAKRSQAPCSFLSCNAAPAPFCFPHLPYSSRGGGDCRFG